MMDVDTLATSGSAIILTQRNNTEKVLHFGKMVERVERASEKILNSIIDKISDNVPKQKSVRFSEERSSVSAQMHRFFGRQNSVHSFFGGGKSADVLLWRNKKISSSVLTMATAIWILFEWLNYQFLSLLAFALVIGMLIQFVWSNASRVLNRSSSQVPRFVISDDIFVNVAVSLGSQVNHFLGFIQDVACGRNLKQFVVVVACLGATVVIGSWCNFLTVLYVGFVCAHTLPVLYEKNEDRVDKFLDKILGQMRSQYVKLNGNLLSRIPKQSLLKKNEKVS